MTLKQLFIALFILSPVLAFSQKRDYRIPSEPAAKKSLNEIKIRDYKKIASISIISYSTDSLHQRIKEPDYKIVFACNYPKLESFRIKLESKDTSSRIEYLYYSDVDALKSSKVFQLGETAFKFYDKKGKLTYKENYFNYKLSSKFYYYYDESDNLIKLDKYLSEFSKEHYTEEFFYNEKNQLIGKKGYDKGKLINDHKYSTEKKEDDSPEWIKEMKRKSVAKYNQKAQYIKDNTFYEYDSNGIWIKRTLNAADGRIHITERKIIYK